VRLLASRCWVRVDHSSAEGVLASDSAGVEKYDVLLIADEVICGFGRLGARSGRICMRLSGSDYVAKGLTSAYLPLSLRL